MIEKIKGIVMDQMILINSIAKSGTTSIVRTSASNESSKLHKIIESDLSIDDFIKKYRSTLTECCISLYVKLSDDSRSLPTTKLKDICKEESERIMEIWKYIENSD